MSRTVSKNKRKSKTIKNSRRINRSPKKDKHNSNPFGSAIKRKKNSQVKRTNRNIARNKKKIAEARRYAKKMLNFFNSDTINNLAITTGFLLRCSKLIPVCFLSGFALSYFSDGAKSLELIGSNLLEWFDISVSAQALSDRLKNKKTVKFFKKSYQFLLKQKCETHILKTGYGKFLTMFKGIKIGDSSQIELSKKLAKHFKGSGGAASKSALKLNVLFDLSTNTTVNVDIKPGSYSDSKLGLSDIQYLKKGELLIRDLGYFMIDSLKKVSDMGAYYLSRLKKDVKIFLSESDEKAIERNFLKKETKNGRKIVDMQIFLGHQKLPSRLIAFKVPKWVLKQRLKKFKSSNKKEPSEEYVEWAGFTAFITNIDGSICAAELIVELYTLRWQIELLFKSYKSTLKIDVIRGTHPNSVLCIVYAKLIGILIAEKIISFVTTTCEENQEISIDKFIKWLKNADKLVQAILSGNVGFLLEKLITDQMKYVCKDRKKKTPSSIVKVQEVLQEPKMSFLHNPERRKSA